MEVKSPEELRAYLQAELDRQYSPDELSALSRVYAKLGLLPANVQLGDALLKLYTAQVAGFYDPHAGKLFLVSPGAPSPGVLTSVLGFILRRDLVGEMLLAHELTHALQDQNFAILGAADDRSNDDRALAIRSVLEGDATLSGFAYVFGGLPKRSLLDLVQQLEGIPAEVAAAMPQIPPVLREELVFQYSAGANFVSWAYLRAGWRGVNALLAHPPTSSEQILWPEKYYVQPDDPTEVRIGGLEDYETGASWRVLEENTLGELMVRILAQAFLEPARAVEVARGWDGDRFVAFGANGRMHVYWLSIWDSERDASEFFFGERDILARHFADASGGGDDLRWSGAGADPYCLERRGDKVLVVLGVAPEECTVRAPAIWAKSSFTREAPSIHIDLAALAR